MNTARQQLIKRIRDGIPDLDLAVQKALRGWHLVSASPDNHDLYLDSVALNLQSFYSGLERIFELVARSMDRRLPEGDNWHQDLLRQMAGDWEDVRPAVISQMSADRLDEYRRFRHVVRNIYAADLLPERMSALLSNLPRLWSDLQAELSAYADLLQQAGDAGRAT